MGDRLRILFLAHRIPYPPNKGDKIRSYHFLRHLAQVAEVHLCTLVDDPADARHVPRLEALCESVLAVPLHPRRARLLSLPALLGKRSLSQAYFGSRRLRARVNELLGTGGIDLVFAFSSVMADYMPDGGGNPGRPPLIVDFVDVDSDKWRQYGERFGGPKGWLYRREGRTLAAFERRVAAHCDRAIIVSEGEADLLKAMAPDARVSVVPNGVDLDYFDPGRPDPGPPVRPEGRPLLVFTGAMDYWPNVDAVRWFAEDVFGAVRERLPEARFYIVGRGPTPEVQALARDHPNVVVTGAVDDVRPYLAAADLVVAPMRVGRGVQNKVVEAMAMARPVVTTPLGLRGIPAEAGKELAVAEGAEAFARACLELLAPGAEGTREALGRAGRAWVEGTYTWEHSLRALDLAISQATRRTPPWAPPAEAP